MKSQTKIIKVTLKDNDDTKVNVQFHGGAFTPAQFTSLFMAILETYTLGLLKTNEPKDIFLHFNRVFGIYLNKLVPEEEHYSLDKSHEEFKKFVNETLDKPLSPQDVKDTEDNRFAAYLIARDILVNEIGLTEDAADVIINKRLGLGTTLKNPGSITNETEDTAHTEADKL